MKRLYKSDTNKSCSGVIGGIGEYFNIDPVILRLIFVLIVMVTGVFPGLIAYLIAIFIVPKKPKISPNGSNENQKTP